MMNKKAYTLPEISVIALDVSDVISTSEWDLPEIKELQKF